MKLPIIIPVQTLAGLLSSSRFARLARLSQAPPVASLVSSCPPIPGGNSPTSDNNIIMKKGRAKKFETMRRKKIVRFKSTKDARHLLRCEV